MDDKQKELERLEQELLDGTLAKLIEEKKPAFEDPEMPGMAKRDVAYHNYSNNYGKGAVPNAKAARKQAAEEAVKKKNDRILIGLMITASVLCVGILCVLIYWLEMFFR